MQSPHIWAFIEFSYCSFTYDRMNGAELWIDEVWMSIQSTDWTDLVWWPALLYSTLLGLCWRESDRHGCTVWRIYSTPQIQMHLINRSIVHSPIRSFGWFIYCCILHRCWSCRLKYFILLHFYLSLYFPFAATVLIRVTKFKAFLINFDLLKVYFSSAVSASPPPDKCSMELFEWEFRRVVDWRINLINNGFEGFWFSVDFGQAPDAVKSANGSLMAYAYCILEYAFYMWLPAFHSGLRVLIKR